MMRRIVLDTNCLLMSIASRSPYHKIWTDFLDGKVEWCVSTEILAEYTEILEQKTTPWLAETVVDTIVNNEHTIRVSPNFFFKLIEADPDDNKFVDCAVCGNAELMLTFNFNKNKQAGMQETEVAGKKIIEAIV